MLIKQIFFNQQNRLNQREFLYICRMSEKTIIQTDFYILSSRYEGFPTVLFEAITLKKYRIATDVSGVQEVLENGKLGLIVENSDQGIYEGMKKALTEPEFFEQYQENLKDYKLPFNLENSVNKIMEIIDE